MATNMLSYSVVGSKDTVQKGLEQILQKTKADELMVVGAIYDLEARIRSFELLSQIFNPNF